MNSLEVKMLNILKYLKCENKYLSVKVDFEAEGTRICELASILKIVFGAGAELTIKIGGCEAILDINLAKIFGANTIVAPMVESGFALKKFKDAAKAIYKEHVEEVSWVANAETITCFNNLDDILGCGVNFLNGITIGRVDLCCSMGFERKDIDSAEVFNICRGIAEKVKQSGFMLSVGGGLGANSFEVISKIGNFLDRVETRKLVFNFENNFSKFKYNIEKATEFELLYLKNKSNYYKNLCAEDEVRIKLLEQRIAKF